MSILNLKTFDTFDGHAARSLSEMCLDLFTEQKENWQDLRQGYESLKNVRERNLVCRGFSVRLQHNPGRMKSSTAEIGGNNSLRPCFLCMGRLPADQKGIVYRDEYLLLCNPMPVFSSHLTFSHLDHRPQAIAEQVGILFDLTADLGPAWTVLYNGPACGASAPDHFHFQAIPSGRLPIEKQIDKENRLRLVSLNGAVLLYQAQGLGREVIVMKGGDPVGMARTFHSFLSALKKVLLTDDEPMINLAVLYQESKWRLLIFPRRKHRPEAFFREGNARIVVSPGAIDMGGLLITPLQRDFDRLDAAAVETIYREVSLDGKTLKEAIKLVQTAQDITNAH